MNYLNFFNFFFKLRKKILKNRKYPQEVSAKFRSFGAGTPTSFRVSGTPTSFGVSGRDARKSPQVSPPTETFRHASPHVSPKRGRPETFRVEFRSPRDARNAETHPRPSGTRPHVTLHLMPNIHAGVYCPLLLVSIVANVDFLMNSLTCKMINIQ